MKNFKLKKTSVVQTSNVMALLYVPLGMVYVLIGAALYAWSTDTIGAITFMIMGALLPLIGWAMVALMTLILNLALKITGGITLTFEEDSKNK